MADQFVGLLIAALFVVVGALLGYGVFAFGRSEDHEGGRNDLRDCEERRIELRHDTDSANEAGHGSAPMTRHGTPASRTRERRIDMRREVLWTGIAAGLLLAAFLYAR